MPNITGKGLFGPPGVPPIGIWGTIAGTTPLPAIAVWASGANGVPVLIWATVAGAPSGASATYVAGGSVNIAWTPHATVTADSYDIRRADGSLAGNVLFPDTTFTDTEPRAVTGSYTVTAKIGTSSSTSVATNSLALNAAPASLSQAWRGTPTWGPRLTWTNPSYGRPQFFNIYESAVGAAGPWTLIAQVSGSTLTWDRQYFPTSSTRWYEVRAVLGSDYTGAASASTSTTRGTATIPFWQVAVIGATEATKALRFTWAAPAYGTPDAMQVWYDDVHIVNLPGNATLWDHAAPRGELHIYEFRAVYNNVGIFGGNRASAGLNARQPATVSVSSFGSGWVTVSWTAPPSGTWTGFLIQRLVNDVQQANWFVGAGAREIRFGQDPNYPAWPQVAGTAMLLYVTSNAGNSNWVKSPQFNPGVYQAPLSPPTYQ